MPGTGRIRFDSRKPSPTAFVASAIVTLALLGNLAVWFDREYSRMEHVGQSLGKVAELNATALAVVASLRQAEAAHRGYVLTGDPNFIASYEPARRTANEKLADFATSPSAPVVRSLVSAKFAEIDQSLRYMRAGRRTEAVRFIASRNRLGLTRRIEQMMQGEVARDRRILARGHERYLARANATRRTIWALLSALSLAVVIGMAVLWKYRRERWIASAEAEAAFIRQRIIFDSTSDAIVTLKTDGMIQQVNAAALAMLGYQESELLQQPLSKILEIGGGEGEGDFERSLGIVNEQLTASHLVNRTACARDGTLIPVDVALGLMRLCGGLHIVASIRDISHRKEIDQLKDMFVATVSHELRTPLTSLVGSLGLLHAGSAGRLPDDARELVEIAESNTRRLIRLTDDILDLQKLESGMKFEFDKVDLGALMAEAAREYQAIARGRGVSIVVSQPPEPYMVVGDRQRLLQVAGNLLSNAVRHTGADTEIKIDLVVTNGQVEARITDQGEGVPADFRESIFNRFSQGPSKDGGGTGLGLAIAREIMARHNGSIWCEAASSGGATFAFTLKRGDQPPD